MNLIILFVSFFAGTIFGIAVGRQQMKDECIDRNIAHYDPKTAKFTWDVENPNHRPT